jgi:hypothetical protein
MWHPSHAVRCGNHHTRLNAAPVTCMAVLITPMLWKCVVNHQPGLNLRVFLSSSESAVLVHSTTRDKIPKASF